jgi:hypothetical protein
MSFNRLWPFRPNWSTGPIAYWPSRTSRRVPHSLSSCPHTMPRSRCCSQKIAPDPPSTSPAKLLPLIVGDPNGDHDPGDVDWFVPLHGLICSSSLHRLRPRQLPWNIPPSRRPVPPRFYLQFLLDSFRILWHLVQELPPSQYHGIQSRLITYSQVYLFGFPMICVVWACRRYWTMGQREGRWWRAGYPTSMKRLSHRSVWSPCSSHDLFGSLWMAMLWRSPHSGIKLVFHP